MPVNYKHREYEEYAQGWKRIRHAIAGEDVVKEAGTLHLPRPSGQHDHEYQAYLKRAVFYGASGRTLQGLQGAIFRKNPMLEVPRKLEDHLDDITLTGLPFNVFAKSVTEEVLGMGRCGVLVDRPPNGQGRAYLRMYTAESIINWRTTNIDGREVVEQIVLHEEKQRPERDGFGTQFYDTYRVLELTEEGYEVRIFEERQDQAQEFTETERYTPNIRGERFDYIPFVFISPTDLLPSVQKSPLLDLVNVNMSHYRTQADLEQGNYLTSQPTPYIIGQRNPEQADWNIGSGTIWFLSEGAQTGMLEYQGAGLSFLEKALDRKQSLMAMLGARLLEESKKTAETAETVRLRGNGESSILVSIADTVSDGLQNAMRWLSEWEGTDPTMVTVELNKDFLDSRLEPQEITALVQAWQAGALGQQDLLFNLQRGEILRPDVSIEEVTEELDGEMKPPLESPQAVDDEDDDEDDEDLSIAV